MVTPTCDPTQICWRFSDLHHLTTDDEVTRQRVGKVDMSSATISAVALGLGLMVWGAAQAAERPGRSPAASAETVTSSGPQQDSRPLTPEERRQAKPMPLPGAS